MEKSEMTFHITWATCIVLSIAAISHYIAQYNIEADKQTAFMMKACVDAGGSWQKLSWGPIRDCVRPNNR